MALEITWGTPEAHQLADSQTKRLIRIGIYTTHAAYFRTKVQMESADLGRAASYKDALESKLPLLAFVADETNSSGLPSKPHELHVAKVDPDTGVRLDVSSISVADLSRQDTLPIWRINGEPRYQLTRWQALLALAEAIELGSHGLVVR